MKLRLLSTGIVFGCVAVTFPQVRSPTPPTPAVSNPKENLLHSLYIKSYLSSMLATRGYCSHDPSWRQFQEKVASRIELPKDFRVPENDEGVTNYFQKVVNKAHTLKEKKPKASDQMVAKNCMDMLVRFPHIVLENTVNNVRNCSASRKTNRNKANYAIDHAAKSLMCAEVGFSTLLGRVPGDNDFPDCGVRYLGRNYSHSEAHHSFLAEDSDFKKAKSELLKYNNLPYLPHPTGHPPPLLRSALSCDRLLPHRAAFVIALLGFNENVGNSSDSTYADRNLVEDFAFHLKPYLEATPGRKVIFGAITNLHQCVFVVLWARQRLDPKKERCYQPYHSSVVIGREEVARELASFCASHPNTMGLNPDLFHSPQLTVDANLGNGWMGTVLSGNWKEDRIALKVSIYKYAVDLERALLQYLEARGVAQVPRIHRAAQEDLYSRYNESCTAFSTVLIPVSAHDVTMKEFLEVWGILRSLHSEGIVHCDVCVDNVLRDESGKLYLVGFGAAQFYTDTLSPDMHEQLVTASGKTLAELQALYHFRFVGTASSPVLRDCLPTLPADEDCAIIYLTMQVTFPDSVVNRKRIPVTEDGQEAWLEGREEWHEHWCLYATVEMQQDINTVRSCMTELEESRADPTYTAEHIHSAVLIAVETLYRLKEKDEAPKKVFMLAHMWPPRQTTSDKVSSAAVESTRCTKRKNEVKEEGYKKVTTALIDPNNPALVL